jgi:hypothetical protein
VGYTLTPYAVDLGRITAVLGSKDQALLDLLTEKFRDEFDSIDSLGEGCEEDDEEDGDDRRGPVRSVREALPMIADFLVSMLRDEPEEEPKQKEKDSAGKARPPCASAAEALRHLILGEAPDRRVGFKYGYVLECLCRHFGETLPHDAWCDLRHGSLWFEDLDKTLRDAGVPAKMLSVSRHLAERGPPIAIPKYRDFPSIGYLTQAEIRKALAALSKARIDDLGEEEDDEQDEEPWLPEGLDDVREWLRACADSQRDLVCFYA